MTATRTRTAPRKVKKPLRKPIEWRRYLQRLSVIAGVSVTIFACIIGYRFAVDHLQFPIAEVIVDAPAKQYLDSEAIQRAVAPELTAGFFGMDVRAVQQRVLEVPWIATASVRRVWPGSVVIRVEQHRPVMRWGRTKLISQQGILYEPPHLHNTMHLALLDGDDAYHEMVYQKYQQLSQRFAAFGQIDVLSRSSRGGWSMRLANGLTIDFGSTEVDARVERTLRFMRHFNDQLTALKHIDARYSNGVAVELEPHNSQHSISEEAAS